MNKGDLSLVDKLGAANVVDHSLAPGLPPGAEGVKQWFAMLRKGFPDVRATIDDMIIDGDKVVTRTTMRGTHKGEFWGFPRPGSR